MSAAVVIARASLAEHSRRRLTLFFLMASVLFTAPLVYLAKSPDVAGLVDTPRGLGALAAVGVLQYLGLFAALATSMGNIGRPFASGEALTILARPVSRPQYALGRLLGSASFVVGFCMALAVETSVIQLVSGGQFTGILWGHWAVTAFNLIVVASLATLLSAVVASPVIVAATTFFGYLTISALTAVHQAIASGSYLGPLAHWFEIAWYATPKLLTSPLTAEAVRGSSEARSSVLQTTPALVGVAAGWVVLLAALAAWFTSRKDV